MPRNLDATLAAHLGDPVIGPAYFVEIDFRSGKEYVWSGVGDFVGPEGKTFQGVGNLGSVGPIGEGTDVKAEGTSITLSGIGDSLIDVPGLVPTPPDPPFPPAPGESVAWSYARSVTPRGLITYPPIPASIFNGFCGVSSASNATPTTCIAQISGGDVFLTPTVGVQWRGFAIPPEVPPGATITHVYAVAHGVAVSGGFSVLRILGILPTWDGTPVDVHTLAEGLTVDLTLLSTLPCGAAAGAFDFLGVAVYYVGTPKSKMTLLQEALGDVWVGAPVKIWFGLLAACALVGVPYLIFSGLVDKPSVHVGLDTLAITLALENRLVNLQRANQRRYTAADQKIYYPTDMAFNWVESLNDIALRWGS